MSIGLGVMVNRLVGNSNSFAAYERCLGKTISEIKLDEDANELRITFSDGYKVRIFDDGQSCCEARYMTTSDNIQEYVGAVFKSAAIKEAPDIHTDSEWETHEVEFLEIVTSKGSITFENHNEHNGYYGGFSVAMREMK